MPHVRSRLLLPVVILLLSPPVFAEASDVSADRVASVLAELKLCAEAESLHARGLYPVAARTYVRLLDEFPATSLRPHVLRRLYDIGNGWLDDTRTEMAQARKNGPNSWRQWRYHFHFSKSKPILDEEGRAVRLLNRVVQEDPQGPLADKAVFLTGSVHFFRNRFGEADRSFSRLVELHPSSPLAPQAAELAIISKCFHSDELKLNGKMKLIEARQLIVKMYRDYPEHAVQKHDFLRRQLAFITMKLEVIETLESTFRQTQQAAWVGQLRSLFRGE